jgi:hypothetical protein
MTISDPPDTIITVPRAIRAADGAPVCGSDVPEPVTIVVDVLTTTGSCSTDVVVVLDAGWVVTGTVVSGSVGGVVPGSVGGVVCGSVVVVDVVDVVDVVVVVVVVVVGGVVVVVVVVEVVVVGGGIKLRQNCTLEMSGVLPPPTDRPTLEKCMSDCDGEYHVIFDSSPPLTTTALIGTVEWASPPSALPLLIVTTCSFPAGAANTYV